MIYVAELTQNAARAAASWNDLMNEVRLADSARNIGGPAEEGKGRVTGDLTNRRKASSIRPLWQARIL